MNIIDNLAYELYGMTKKEAHEKHICISCRQVPPLESPVDINEYRISGLCGRCFYESTGNADSQYFD
jgi:hypothetical protein